MCKAWIVDTQKIGNTKYFCVKLQEISPVAIRQQAAASDNKAGTEVKCEETINDGKYEYVTSSIINEGQSSQAEEDIRLIKDSRATISEKRVPKSVITLRKTLILIALIQIASEIYLKTYRDTIIRENQVKMNRLVSFGQRNL